MKVFVVMGGTGEYSDETKWAVVAYKDLDKAKEHILKATKVAKELQATKNYEGINPYDPIMKMDYTGTYYFLYEVELI